MNGTWLMVIQCALTAAFLAVCVFVIFIIEWYCGNSCKRMLLRQEIARRMKTRRVARSRYEFLKQERQELEELGKEYWTPEHERQFRKVMKELDNCISRGVRSDDGGSLL